MIKQCFICGSHYPHTYNKMIDICLSCVDEIYDGDFTVYKKIQIHVAHFLPGHNACGSMHGHSMNIVIGVKGTLNPSTGMIIDFSELKKIMQEEIISKFDHQCLNNIIPMPTAEYLSFYIYYQLKLRDIGVVMVRVHETDNNYAEYKPR